MPRKRGKLSNGEMNYIRQNCFDLSVEEIARHLNRTSVPIQKFIDKENLKARNMTDDELGGELDRVYGFFPRLAERKNQLAGSMSGGEQQMCAIGRGLMARPKLLLIDELSLGLAPRLVEELCGFVKQINEEGVTIMLVEQDVLTAFELASRAYVFESGRVAMSGPTGELLENPEVKKAYLGI